MPFDTQMTSFIHSFIHLFTSDQSKSQDNFFFSFFLFMCLFAICIKVFLISIAIEPGILRMETRNDVSARLFGDVLQIMRYYAFKGPCKLNYQLRRVVSVH